MKRYIDRQMEPAVTLCKKCYGEIYEEDECYFYDGGYLCASCAEDLDLQDSSYSYLGRDLLAMWQMEDDWRWE